MADEFSHAEYELARLRAFDHWQGSNQRIPMAEPSDVRLRDPAFGSLQKSLLDQSIAEQQSRLAALDRGLARRRADLEGTRQQLEKLRRILPLIEVRAGLRCQAAANQPRLQNAIFGAGARANYGTTGPRCSGVDVTRDAVRHRGAYAAEAHAPI